MTTAEFQESVHQGDAKPYPFSTGAIKTRDIKMGYDIGDCYFLSGLSSMCGIPELVERVFVTREISKYAIYCVALFVNGAWESVVLDSIFPVDTETGEVNTWVCAENRDKNGIWVMLVEKAWAKVHGGYLNIDGGFVIEAITALTGAPSRMYFLKDPNADEEKKEEKPPHVNWTEDDDWRLSGCAWKDKETKLRDTVQAWDSIYSAHKQGYIMSVTSRDLIGWEESGILPMHAYLLMGAYEVYKKDGDYLPLGDHEGKDGE